MKKIVVVLGIKDGARGLYKLIAILSFGNGTVARVLVVDDEFLIRSNAIRMLDDAGHEVVEAQNADEAIHILETRGDIEIVFSDIQMPGSMDGVRLLKVIRDRWPPIRLILTSGRPLPKEADLPVGIPFLAKPYQSDQLLGALQRAA